MPFHGLTWRKEGFEISLDAFCETGVRAPACFIRLEVKNDGSAKNGLPMADHSFFAIFLNLFCFNKPVQKKGVLNMEISSINFSQSVLPKSNKISKHT